VIITLGLPLVFAKPKVGVPMYLGGWTSDNRPQVFEKTILYQRGDKVASLDRDGDAFVLDLGDGENRFNDGSLDELEHLLQETEAAAPCALVTTAHGKHWSNGLDLEWLATQGEDAPAFLVRVHELLARVLEMGVPSVAALQGQRSPRARCSPSPTTTV
jgi:hypothetical protein